VQQLRQFLDIGGWFDAIIDWLVANLGWLFDGIEVVISAIVDAVTGVLNFPPPIVLIAILTGLAWWVAGWGVGLFTLLGFGLIWIMALWTLMTSTFALVLTAVLIALVIGIPVGIWASKNNTVWNVLRPILDFMQTMPAFIYLIPAVILFGLGAAPGIVATLIFSIPPVIRLTNLGIRQVPTEIKEAALSFGSTNRQMLIKAELPVALSTILAGVNQTIMLALSMVVIAGLIGAGGLGNEVVRGITQLRIDAGFEGGLAIVILAVFLDRVTQALGTNTQKQK
jgi:glycine betaine/proline transport system permease protein